MSELRSRSREQRKDRRSHGASQPVSVADERLGEFAPSVVVRPWRERKRMPGSRSRLREQRKDCEKTQPRRARTSRSRSREDREDLWSKLDVDEYAAEERAGKYPFMNIGKRLSRPPRPTCVEEWPQEWPPPKVDVDEDEESEVEDEINEADCVWLSMETAFGKKKWDKVDMKVSDIRLGNRGVFKVGWHQHIAVCRVPKDDIYSSRPVVGKTRETGARYDARPSAPKTRPWKVSPTDVRNYSHLKQESRQQIKKKAVAARPGGRNAEQKAKLPAP